MGLPLIVQNCSNGHGCGNGYGDVVGMTWLPYRQILVLSLNHEHRLESPKMQFLHLYDAGSTDSVYLKTVTIQPIRNDAFLFLHYASTTFARTRKKKNFMLVFYSDKLVMNSNNLIFIRKGTGCSIFFFCDWMVLLLTKHLYLDISILI